VCLRYHRDKTPDWKDAAVVVTASFGGTRLFRMKHQETGEVAEFEIEDGSVFVLGAQDNEDYKHSIVRTASEREERYSLTFRSIKTVWDSVAGCVRELRGG